MNRVGREFSKGMLIVVVREVGGKLGVCGDLNLYGGS